MLCMLLFSCVVMQQKRIMYSTICLETARKSLFFSNHFADEAVNLTVEIERLQVPLLTNQLHE